MQLEESINWHFFLVTNEFFCFYDEYHKISRTLTTACNAIWQVYLSSANFIRQKHHCGRINDDLHGDRRNCTSSYGCRKSSERMKRVLPADGRFPRRKAKSFHAQMNDRLAIEDTEAKLIAGLIPTISPSRSRKRKEIREPALLSNRAWLFRRKFRGSFGDNGAISQWRILWILKYFDEPCFPLRSTKWVYASAINLASISDYNLL